MTDQSKEFFRLMCLIRQTESALLDLFATGRLRGTVHTCLGQEACAVGVVTALDKNKDIVFSNHRGHGHYLAYCEDVFGLVAEIMGKPEGICGGIGGSQHLQNGNFYSNGIQGAGASIVAGMALAEKSDKTGALAVSFLGDGTLGQGAPYEAMNIASLWNLPVLFVVEHNQYAQSTPSNTQHAGNLETRAVTFDIPVVCADGMDVASVHEQCRDLADQVRQNSRPAMLFLNTYRFGPHSKGDDFRDPEEIATQRKRDPLKILSRKIGQEASSRIETEVESFVQNIIHELSK